MAAVANSIALTAPNLTPRNTDCLACLLSCPWTDAKRFRRRGTCTITEAWPASGAPLRGTVHHPQSARNATAGLHKRRVSPPAGTGIRGGGIGPDLYKHT